MSDDDIKVIAGNRPTELERLRAELADRDRSEPGTRLQGDEA